MKKTFEYQKDFQLLAEACPPEYFTYQNINPVFRWVFDALSDKNNYLSGHFTHHPYSTKEYFDRFNLIYTFE
jgi:hypothetical protein